MNCDVGEVTESLENEQSHFLALPTSQLILQPFRCFTYVTAHSPTLLSPLLRHKIFTFVTWRAAHARTPSFFITLQGVTLLLLSQISCAAGNGRFWNIHHTHLI